MEFMLPWEIVGNPVLFVGSGDQVGHGWTWRLERDHVAVRYIDVLFQLTTSKRDVVAPECGQAIDTCGRSAIEGVLEMNVPPTTIVITNEEIQHRRGRA